MKIKTTKDYFIEGNLISRNSKIQIEEATDARDYSIQFSKLELWAKERLTIWTEGNIELDRTTGMLTSINSNSASFLLNGKSMFKLNNLANSMVIIDEDKGFKINTKDFVLWAYK